MRACVCCLFIVSGGGVEGVVVFTLRDGLEGKEGRGGAFGWGLRGRVRGISSYWWNLTPESILKFIHISRVPGPQYH